QHVPRHTEVDQENPTALESNDQILAATLDRLDALAGQLGRHLGRIERTRQARIVDLDVLESAPDEHGLEPAPNRLDLGQLRHTASVAMSRFRAATGYAAGTADERTSRRIGRSGGGRSPNSYASSTSRAATDAEARSRAWISARVSPARTSSPRLRLQTTPTEWSIVSSFVRRPAPR